MRDVVIFCAKAVAFTVIFWTVWLFALRPVFYSGADESSKASQAADDALRRKSLEQSERFDRLQEQNERQLKTSDETLERQDALLNRWEKVIERWEKAAPSHK